MQECKVPGGFATLPIAFNYISWAKWFGTKRINTLLLDTLDVEDIGALG